MVLQYRGKNDNGSLGTILDTNGGFCRSEMGVEYFGNSRNHENRGFEVFGHVESGVPLAKSLRNICPISSEMLKCSKPSNMKPQVGGGAVRPRPGPGP